MLNKHSLVSINGKITPSDQAKISIFDRGFLFGDSVYEVTRTYEGVPFLLDLHIKRLNNSARLLGMNLTLSNDQLQQQIQAILDKILPNSETNEVYLRIIVTRGEGTLVGLDPGLSTKNNTVIIAYQFDENPSWWYRDGVNIILAETRRVSKDSVDPNIKSGNYLNSILAITEAKGKGCFDAIMLNNSGMVAEGTTSNVWMVKNEIIVTPPRDAGLLEGITRETLLDILRDGPRKHEVRNIGPEELKAADEVFLTSSTREIVPVRQIDKSIIGGGKPGPITQELATSFKQFIQNWCLKQ